MRSAGNFHPEWGYLAPAPSLMRTIRIALVATAVGAVAGAVVVVSLVERPGSNEDSAITAHALLARSPVITAPAVVSRAGARTVVKSTPSKPTLSPTQPQARFQPSLATTAPSAPPAAAIATAAAPQSSSALTSADKPDSISPPLPLPAPTDATVAANTPAADAVRVPAEADAVVAPDTVDGPRVPTKRSAKRHRYYEPYRRPETTRNRWRENSGFGPLFRLFSFRTGSPYSSN